MRVDIIIPVYNEEDGIQSFHQKLCEVIDPLPDEFRIYYIDDGSTDKTALRLTELSSQDARLTVVELSRNFGHQAALTAGIDLSRGDFAITMDGDGEHPPSMIPEMLRLARNDYDIVLTQRVEPDGSAGFKSGTSNLFYRLLNWISDTRILPGSADFRGMSRTVVQSLQQMREYHRFLRGMVAWIGYRTAILPYQQPGRIAGKSKYSLSKMVRLAMNGIFSFSLVPLYIAISIGVLFLVLAVVEVIYVLSIWLTGDRSSLAPGWSSLMFMLLVVGGTLMVSLGLIGIYIGYIFQEVKGRPIYLVRRQWTGTPTESITLKPPQEPPLE